MFQWPKIVTALFYFQQHLQDSLDLFVLRYFVCVSMNGLTIIQTKGTFWTGCPNVLPMNELAGTIAACGLWTDGAGHPGRAHAFCTRHPESQAESQAPPHLLSVVGYGSIGQLSEPSSPGGDTVWERRTVNNNFLQPF